MAKLIKGDIVVANEWKVLRLADGEAPAEAKLPFGNVLVPLAVWQARKGDLVRRHWDQGHLLGVWLGPRDDPAQLAADLDHFSVIAVHFPLAGDGRGYSMATLLRTRYGYVGELRAIGAVGRDYLHFLRRVGFDAFEVSDPESALASLDDFSEAYQTAADGRLPAFRRVAPGALAV
jgi:uncharacterized protein (DUF934 family)